MTAFLTRNRILLGVGAAAILLWALAVLLKGAP